MDLEMIMRLPRWLSGKESTCQCRRCVFDPWFRKLPPEKEMTTHFGVLAWEIPWTEEPGGPQSTWLQRVTHARATEHTPSLLTGSGSPPRSLRKVTSWQAQEPQDSLGPSRKDKFTQTLGIADNFWWQITQLAPQPPAGFKVQSVTPHEKFQQTVF